MDTNVNNSNLASRSFSLALLAAFTAAGITGCGGASGDLSQAGSAQPPVSLGTDGMQGAAPSQNAFADFDRSEDPEQVTVALKYVTFLQADGTPVLKPEAAKEGVRRMNKLFSSCNLRFIVQDYSVEDATKAGVSFGLDSMSELDPIRERFVEKDRLVVTFTGPWNHASTGAANAWTTMPGTNPAGAVLESRVAEDAEIIAHELGHYLGLDHVNDQTNLMNPVIYKTSTYLSPEQCAIARETATTGYWKDARR